MCFPTKDLYYQGKAWGVYSNALLYKSMYDNVNINVSNKKTVLLFFPFSNNGLGVFYGMISKSIMHVLLVVYNCVHI